MDQTTTHNMDVSIIETDAFVSKLKVRKVKIEHGIVELLKDIKDPKSILKNLVSKYEKIREDSKNISTLIEFINTTHRKKTNSFEQESFFHQLNTFLADHSLPEALIESMKSCISAHRVKKELIKKIRKYKQSQRGTELYYWYLKKYKSASLQVLFKTFPFDILRKKFLYQLLKELKYQPKAQRSLKTLVLQIRRYYALLTTLKRYEHQTLFDTFESLYFAHETSHLKVLFAEIDPILEELLNQKIQHVESNIDGIVSITTYIRAVEEYKTNYFIQALGLEFLFEETAETLRSIQYEERGEMLIIMERFKRKNPEWMKEYEKVLREYDKFGGPDAPTITDIFNYLYTGFYLEYSKDYGRRGALRGLAHLRILEESYPDFVIYRRLHHQIQERMITESELANEVKEVKERKAHGISKEDSKELKGINIPLPKVGPHLLSPKFLHLLFFRQKSMVIYPDLPLAKLKNLTAFTVGHTEIFLEPADLDTLKQAIEDGLKTKDNPMFICKGLEKKQLKRLLFAYEDIHFIFTTDQVFSEIETRLYPSIIFYNWRQHDFYNYTFGQCDLECEQAIFKQTPSLKVIRKRLTRAKEYADSFYCLLSTQPEIEIYDYLNGDEGDAYRKIFEFLENFYPNIESMDSLLICKNSPLMFEKSKEKGIEMNQ